MAVRLHVKQGYFFTAPKRVNSPTCGPPPPCKQAFRRLTGLWGKKSQRDLDEGMLGMLVQCTKDSFAVLTVEGLCVLSCLKKICSGNFTCKRVLIYVFYREQWAKCMLCFDFDRYSEARAAEHHGHQNLVNYPSEKMWS